MRHTTDDVIEYGRFPDPAPDREYIVTSSLCPANVRVFAVEGDGAPEMVCTVYGLPSFPEASWGGRWVSNMTHWKQWLVDQAATVYGAYSRAARLAEIRRCDD